jgi:TnpA family transposase
MTEDERLRHLLAALYAYGCNCGPTQAARSLQLLKNQVVYIRRRYMTTPNLMEAAAMISQAYQQTPMAQRLGNLNVLLTDSMQVRTLKDSLIARQHHRYLSGKSTLIYQHVAPNCICLFTQALICNVSEAIHMLVGTLACHSEQEPIINICDSAGKSNLVFGLSRLLNIKLYPRVRSRHLKLWGTGDVMDYQNIAAAIAGQIRWDRIERSWQDIMWILASINAGTAKPIVILNHLVSNPQHPAAQGLEELGKLERSLYLLRYGMEMELRRFVISHTSRREHWNKFAREVLAFGDLIREKTLENQEEVFWFLTVVQNAIVLWNALSLENVLQSSSSIKDLSDEDLKRILPTMTEHINFVGEFNPDFNRKPPFELKQLVV